MRSAFAQIFAPIPMLNQKQPVLALTRHITLIISILQNLTQLITVATRPRLADLGSNRHSTPARTTAKSLEVRAPVHHHNVVGINTYAIKLITVAQRASVNNKHHSLNAKTWKLARDSRLHITDMFAPDDIHREQRAPDNPQGPASKHVSGETRLSLSALGKLCE